MKCAWGGGFKGNIHQRISRTTGVACSTRRAAALAAHPAGRWWGKRPFPKRTVQHQERIASVASKRTAPHPAGHDGLNFRFEGKEALFLTVLPYMAAREAQGGAHLAGR